MAIPKYYNGSSWVTFVWKYWSGSNWITPVPKFWDGTNWIELFELTASTSPDSVEGISGMSTAT